MHKCLPTHKLSSRSGRTKCWTVCSFFRCIDRSSKASFSAIVEQVRDGSTLRVRLILSDELHQIVSIMLAGVKSPKFGRDNEPNEQYAEEVRSHLPGHLASDPLPLLPGQILHGEPSPTTTRARQIAIALRTASPPILGHNVCSTIYWREFHWCRNSSKRKCCRTSACHWFGPNSRVACRYACPGRIHGTPTRSRKVCPV